MMCLVILKRIKDHIIVDSRWINFKNLENLVYFASNEAMSLVNLNYLGILV
jgi:hypothetical protein